MGQSSKKKKKGGKRSKGRTPSKDKHADEDNELLTEEITALCAIFQEDCKVAETPPKIIIKLRPYSKHMGFDDPDVSALLFVRCLPGYPYKCPKLQIIPEKGLSEADADKLLSLLHELANSNAREGRVMIFNLVEAAQEFLSEIVPLSQAHKSVPCLTKDDNGQLFQKDMAASLNKGGSSRGPFVYGFVDLFGSSGESWHWGLSMDQRSETNSSLQLHASRVSKFRSEFPDKKLSKGLKLQTMLDKKQPSVLFPTSNLEKLEEENDDDDEKNISTSTSSEETVEKFVEFGFRGMEEHASDVGYEDGNNDDDDASSGRNFHDVDDDHNHVHSDSLSSESMIHHQAPQIIKKDLILVHLLHLACASKGPLFDAFPQIALELYNLGILSDWVRDLALKQPSLFNRIFYNAFQQHTTSSKASQFWKPSADIVQPSTPPPSSRYLNDFEELHTLGHGGFGHVVLCKNKLDGRQYAVKKIRLKDKSLPLNDRILREVATLSRLQHQHVVRYYQAWFETGVPGSHGDVAWGSMTAASSTVSDRNTSSIDVCGQDNKLESTYLYIQMEYCPRTLRQEFESYQFDKERAWHLFRQIVEGLAHIHGQGIIHRDLTPNNIFFDARDDIKIGDFGLAKFLKLEQLDQDPGFLTETTGVSIDGTGQVGTYFYTAPEIEQGWPKIDEKADMYSLGVVFFELWHPFGTAMERQIILSDLKQKGNLPPLWVADFQEQASLLQRLMSPSPSERPSATELLQHAFPPRMEYELLDDILRTMRNSEDTSVYDKVVSSIFDNEALRMKDKQQNGDGLNLHKFHDCSIQYPEFDTELRDHVMEVSREVFRQHCAKHLEIIPMCLVDDSPQIKRSSVKVLTHGGDMLELCYELRLPFVSWVVTQQKSSCKRYEISNVFRRGVGHSPPTRYLQGDFDIVGGASALTEAEVIKVTMDIASHFIPPESCDVHLNHGDLLEAIWSWTGIKAEHRHKVAELLSIMGSLRPQSSEWKSKWAVIRRQLLQELKLGEAIVNRLQTVGLRFCGAADHTLSRLRGALPADKPTRKALDELSDLFSDLRVWMIEKHVYINALMPPSEYYHRDIFFQVHLTRENNAGSLLESALLAIGGRYDYLLHQLWEHEHKASPPGAVGVSLALEMIIRHSSMEMKPFRRNEAGTSVLVCSRGGGGLLVDRMELVSELWKANIKAEFVPLPDPSFTEQYEYANEHDIKCLVIITDTSVSQTNSVKVRHIELKKEKNVERESLVKFLEEAMSKQFRNPSIWI
ncbi:eIF-2-alpha kinase GCN2 isoform X3 [Rhodamnia argentea]|uniref:non-specific serine/threonine protein kinase n=1 Tax=Rhodamnia argentea TaxID=178133 RepID=A0A8B8P019_9MYRT|nr:eIF-2-alpha kinase GCN2 isoform X3 [Rhodamnia argentea]